MMFDIVFDMSDIAVQSSCRDIRAHGEGGEFADP